ncbi:MAG: histidinol-phosphatase [Treponemataceae bacterium]|nr:histidinol-phosphatase [Spirochaetales bacterium]MDY6030798.1 histidinol-phosphatase [Treponemataceae bacterium]
MKTNYHTHSTFCDGKASIEAMIQDAIDSKFDILGFSSHAAFPYQSSWHLKNDKYEEYVSTVRKLALQYKAQIQIQLGFEADFIPMVLEPSKIKLSQFEPDFLIGAVHYAVNYDAPYSKGYPQEESNFPVNLFAVDGSEEEVREGLKNMFDGDGKLACQMYFAIEREMATLKDFDIIAHPDIIRKRNAAIKFFSEEDDWYRREIRATAQVFANSGKVVEVNYGGISRGTLNDTYPSLDFLKILNSMDVPVTISADAHGIGQLNNGYDFAVQQMKKAGYRDFYYLEDKKWLQCSL